MNDADLVFRALADPSRRQILDSLNAQNGQNLSELIAGLGMTRQSASKHIALLEAANLITTLWRGREKLHYLNVVPINDIAERWISAYDQERVRALADLKRSLESMPMSTPQFAYTIYIQTTPERLWQALTDSTFMQRWWGMTCQTDWTVGSPMIWHHRKGVTIADPEQVVLEYTPHRRLAYTWHSMTPELAQVIGLSNEALERLQQEPRSRVAFEIEPLDDVVKLTIIQEDFAPGSLMLQMVTGGWPQVLSSLKSLLETGQPLAIP